MSEVQQAPIGNGADGPASATAVPPPAATQAPPPPKETKPYVSKRGCQFRLTGALLETGSSGRELPSVSNPQPPRAMPSAVEVVGKLTARKALRKSLGFFSFGKRRQSLAAPEVSAPNSESKSRKSKGRSTVSESLERSEVSALGSASVAAPSSQLDAIQLGPSADLLPERASEEEASSGSQEADVTVVRRAVKDVPDLFLANLAAQSYTPVQQAFLLTLAFEMSLHCIHHELKKGTSHDPKGTNQWLGIGTRTPHAFVQHLQRAFNFPPHIDLEIRAKVSCMLPEEFFCRIAELQLDQIGLHKNLFKETTAFEAFKKLETDRLQDTIKQTPKQSQDYPVARFRVEIIEARGLMSKKEVSKRRRSIKNFFIHSTTPDSSDPFVHLKFLKQSYRTVTQKNTASPSWGTGFTFNVYPSATDNEELKITMLYEVSNLPDVKLGTVRISLPALKKKTYYKEEWFQIREANSTKPPALMSGEEEPSGLGELKMRLIYVPLDFDFGHETIDYSSLYRTVYRTLVSTDGADYLIQSDDADSEGIVRASNITSEGKIFAPSPVVQFRLHSYSQSLLQLFAQNYGIRKNYCDMTTLEMLAYYAQSKRHFETIQDILKNYTWEMFSLNIPEATIFNELKSNVLPLLLERIICSCPYALDGTKGRAAQDLFLSAIQLYRYLFPSSHMDRLRIAIAEQLMKRYSGWWAAQTDDTEAQTFACIIDRILEEYNEYQSYFSDSSVPEDIRNLVREVVQFYSLRLETDLRKYFEAQTKPLVGEMPSLVDLLVKAKKLMDSWAQLVPNFEAKIPICKYLELHVEGWIGELEQQLKEWSRSAMSHDDFLPVNVSLSIYCSSSVIDLFNAINMALNFLRPLLLRWTLPSAYIYLEQFAKSSGRIAVGYCEDLLTVMPLEIGLVSEGDDDSIDEAAEVHNKGKITRFLKTRLERLARIVKDGAIAIKKTFRSSVIYNGSDTFQVSEEACVKINNMTVCLQMLNDIATEVGDFYKSIKAPLPDGEKITAHDYIQRLLGATYMKDVRKRIDTAVRSLELHMKPDLLLALEILVGLQQKKQTSPDMALPTVYDYLQERLSVLKRNLSPALMKRLCRRLWASCLDVMAGILLPEDSSAILTDTQLEACAQVYSPLRSVFLEFASITDSGQLGCDSDLHYHMLLLQFYRRTTVDVISLFDLYDDESSNDDPESQMRIMLLRLLQLRTPHDRLATEFVKQHSKKIKGAHSTDNGTGAAHSTSNGNGSAHSDPADAPTRTHHHNGPLSAASAGAKHAQEAVGNLANLAKKQAGKFVSLFKFGK